MLKYLRQQGIVEQFIRFADSKGVKRRNILIHKSYKLMERNLYGNIIYNILGREPYIRYINQGDPTVQKALEILENGEAFPKAPEDVVKEETKDHDLIKGYGLVKPNYRDYYNAIAYLEDENIIKRTNIRNIYVVNPIYIFRG